MLKNLTPTSRVSAQYLNYSNISPGSLLYLMYFNGVYISNPFLLMV